MALILCKQGIKENNTATGERVELLENFYMTQIFNWYTTYT